MRTIQNNVESIITEYPNASQGNNARTNKSKPVTLMDLEHIPPYFRIAKIMKVHTFFLTRIWFTEILRLKFY